MSVDVLIEKIVELKNPTVAGLDPRLEYLPPDMLARHISQKDETLQAAADAFLEFNKGLMDAWKGIVPAVKLQSACYEMLGFAGMKTLYESQKYARELGYYIITDAKRGDIGSTSEAYSAAFLGKVKIGNTEFEPFISDALTVNPYLGSDNLNPFLADCDKYNKMVFVLCRTSNKSSSEVQEQMAGNVMLYQEIARQLAAAGTVGRNGYTQIGVVVGATQPKELSEIRAAHPELFFLVPGYGAQGAGVQEIAGGFDSRGRGAIVNNSRGLMCAWNKNPGDYKQASRDAAIEMRDAISKAITVK